MVAVSETVSKQRGTHRDVMSFSSVVLAKSATVLVTAQKADGDSDQPIGRTKGIAISYLFPILVGNKIPYRIESAGFRFIW